MKQIDEKEALDVLRQAGFTVSEINRLSQLRRAYTTSESDLTPLGYTPLRYVQWFIKTILDHDIWYVLSHQPFAERPKA